MLDCEVNPGGSFVAFCGQASIEIWELDEGNQIRKLDVPGSGWLHSIAWSPDGERLAATSTEGLLILADVNGGTTRTIAAPLSQTAIVGFSSSGSQIILAITAGTELRDARDGTLISSTSYFVTTERSSWTRSRCRDAEFGSTGLLHCSDEGWLWGPESGNLIYESSSGIEAASSNGQLLARFDVPGSISIKDLSSHEMRATMQIPVDADVAAMAFSKNGSVFAVSLDDGSIHLLDLETGQTVRLSGFQGMEGWRVPPNHLEFASCDKVLIARASMYSHVFRFWDIETGIEITGDLFPDIELGTNLDAVALDASLLRIAYPEPYSATDGAITVRDLTENQSIELLGHEALVNDLAFSSNGRVLASGSNDGTAKLWDVSSGECIETIRMPVHLNDILRGKKAYPAISVAFSVDGEYLVVGWNHVTRLYCLDELGGSVASLAAIEGPIPCGRAEARLPIQAEAASSSDAIVVYPGESIQAAIDSAPRGATIQLGNGVWEETIQIDKSLTFRGASYGVSTIVSGHRTEPAITIEAVSETQGIVIRDITITTELAEPASSGVLVEGSTQVLLLNCSVKGFLSAVTVTDSAEASIENCALKRCNFGISAAGSGRVTVTGTELNENWGAGVLLDDESELSATNCDITAGSGHGIYLRDWADATVTGCTIGDNSLDGVHVEDSASISILQSDIRGNGWRGVFLQESGTASILDTTIESNLEGGVALIEWTRLTIKDCSISGNRFCGIGLDGEARADIWGCEIIGNREYGVVLADYFCYRAIAPQSAWFGGVVSGGNNHLPGPGDPDGNGVASVCPSELKFLGTSAGGTLDRSE